MLPISAAADMNSRAADRQYYMSGIKPRETVRSELHRMVEGAGEAAQCRIGDRLIPMVKHGAERLLAVERCDHRAQDGAHPQHHGETSLKTDAAEQGERGDRRHAKTEARDHLCRCRGLRQLAVAACYKRGHELISIVMLLADMFRGFVCKARAKCWPRTLNRFATACSQHHLRKRSLENEGGSRSEI